MLGSISEEMVGAYYEKLVEVWKTLQYPETWKWRWMVLLPKKVDPTIDDLRPISLVEVVRKVWNCLILKRIGRALERYKVLSDKQHAYRPGRGTSSASVQLINALEVAQELSTEVFVASWDTRRAFDSPAKEVLLQSWCRLGVPYSIADFMVGMDRDGFTVIKSDLAQAVMEEKGTEAFGGDGLGMFMAKRGTGQGDVVSPLNWDVFYDIMLTALDGEGDSFYIRSTNEEMVEQGDLAYSDDLVSISATTAGIQSKAEIVCAFMCIFQMAIAVPKLRLYWFDFRREHVDNNCVSIKVWTTNWQEAEVQFSREGAMKYLGSLYDTDNYYDSQFRETLSMVRLMTKMIVRKSMSNKVKAMVLRSCVLSKAPGSLGGTRKLKE
jgi:hypothetical protein